MAEKENLGPNALSLTKRKPVALSKLGESFTVAQLDWIELRHAIVSPAKDNKVPDRLLSSPGKIEPMRQNCSPDVTLPWTCYTDEELHMWLRLYPKPSLQSLPLQSLSTIPSTTQVESVAFSQNNVSPALRSESVPALSPLFGTPWPLEIAAASLNVLVSTTPASAPTLYDDSSSSDFEGEGASPVLASTMGTNDPAEEPANGESISCKCGNPDSWQSSMIMCMGLRHKGGRWYHLVCAHLTMDTIPEDDWYCLECSVGGDDNDSGDNGNDGGGDDNDSGSDNDSSDDSGDGDNDSGDDSGDADFRTPGNRLKRSRRSDSTTRVAKKARGSKAPVRIFATLDPYTPDTPKSRESRPNGGQARKSASSEVSPAARGGNGAAWTTHEQAMATQVMTAMVQEKHRSLGKEERWEEAAQRLKLLNVHRTAAGVKNHWNRVGRAASGVDERQVPKPHKMKTGLQAASKATALRKKRNLARTVTKEGKSGAGKS